jgi:hypothetical protein
LGVRRKEKVRKMREIARTKLSNKKKLFNDDNNRLKVVRLENAWGMSLSMVKTKARRNVQCAT